ncbi:MAG TPA: SpoIIE family protein phosphatase [Baekduia sp.]|nr:SpoIIE family protein phosphatase [Baekduia sp.]
MGRRMREHDWSACSIGDPRSWPQSLRTATSMCLNSRFPMLIWWGPELVKIYNDSYAPILRDKHPRALGSPGREVWPEIWDVIGPMLDAVMHEGQATWSQDQLLLMTRAGFEEETYFTFSYSPIIDESGGIGGVFCAVTETTPSVLGARRLSVLNEVADRAAHHDDPTAVARAAIAALEDDRADVPFALLYEQVDGTAQLVAAAGISDASRQALAAIRPQDALGLDAVLDEESLPPTRVPVPRDVELVDAGDLGPLAGAVVMGLDVGATQQPWRLVLGVPSRVAYDEDLQRFHELACRAVSAALTHAIALQDERRRGAALAELDRAKTDFFTNISHEFRTPLTLLLAPLEDELARRPPEASEGLQIAHRNAMRLLRLVDALLDFSRAEGGRVVAEPRPTDLAALTAQVASSFDSAVADAGLRFDVDLDGLTRPVQVDPELWERILLNLLSNALKHTFAGGIAVRASESDHGAVIAVTDTGIGIGDEHRDRIFDRFYRVPGAPSRTHEGSGIGLALVAELARVQGGTARVEPGPGGVGTTFVVELPFAASGEALPAEPSPLAAAHVEEIRRWIPEPAADDARPQTGGHRILVVDDNADMRDYLRRLLAADADVTTAVDGEDALARLREQPGRFELVVTDVMMPRLDGLGLLTAIRGDAELAGIPVLVLSARAGSEAAVDALDLGADDYVVKPFTATELRARVRSALELARARAVETELQREHALRMEDLYVREHRVAEALQRSLLPERLPAEPHLAVAGRYVAAEDVAVVGGDWYDAVILNDGSLVLTIGDVAGHGLSAAAVMAQLRSATRGYALRGDDPATMLQALNGLVATIDGSPMVTCQVARIDAERRRLEIASAGHPPAVLVEADGVPRMVAGAGPPLGVAAAATWHSQEEELGDDAVLAFYTDGLIERREESLAVGLERLTAAVARLRDRPAEELADGMLEVMRPDEGYSDDVAVLVTALGPVDAAMLSVDLPAHPRSLAMLRRVLRRWLRANDIDGRAAYDIVLALDETASNAMEHAYGAADGTVTVEARRDGPHLRFAVDDRGRWRAQRGDHRGRGLGMMRLLMDEVEVETGEEGTRVLLSRRVTTDGGDG